MDDPKVYHTKNDGKNCARSSILNNNYNMIIMLRIFSNISRMRLLGLTRAPHFNTFYLLTWWVSLMSDLQLWSNSREKPLWGPAVIPSSLP